MDLGIAGRKAIVCASSKGLGRASATALAEAGCELVVNGRTEASVKEAAAELASRYGVKVTPVAADVSSREGQAALLQACPEPDILINNNAGPTRWAFEELDRDKIVDGVIRNMVTPIELIQAVLPAMRERKFGRIVNITSVAVYQPSTRNPLSSGARAGLTSFLAGLAREVAADNVTINFLVPGRFETERLREGFVTQAKRQGRPVEEIVTDAAAAIPTKRFGRTEEFGQLCAYLASAQAGYLTGQNIRLDGGFFKSAF